MQVAEERKADLARLYTLLGRVQALDAMRVAFKEHIKKTGLALVLDEEKARRGNNAVIVLPFHDVFPF